MSNTIFTAFLMLIVLVQFGFNFLLLYVLINYKYFFDKSEDK